MALKHTVVGAECLQDTARIEALARAATGTCTFRLMIHWIAPDQVEYIGGQGTDFNVSVQMVRKSGPEGELEHIQTFTITGYEEDGGAGMDFDDGRKRK